MYHPFDNTRPIAHHQQTQPTAKHQHQHQHQNVSSQTPTCVIHYASINSQGHMLVQIHHDQPNGQPHVQSQYVEPNKLKAFVQQLQKQYPNLNILQQRDGHDTNTQRLRNDAHDSSVHIQSPPQHTLPRQQPSDMNQSFQPYDQYCSSFGLCEPMNPNTPMHHTSTQVSTPMLPQQNKDPNC